MQKFILKHFSFLSSFFQNSPRCLYLLFFQSCSCWDCSVLLISCTATSTTPNDPDGLNSFSDPATSFPFSFSLILLPWTTFPPSVLSHSVVIIYEVPGSSHALLPCLALTYCLVSSSYSFRFLITLTEIPSVPLVFISSISFLHLICNCRLRYQCLFAWFCVNQARLPLFLLLLWLPYLFQFCSFSTFPFLFITVHQHYLFLMISFLFKISPLLFHFLFDWSCWFL